MKRPLDTAEREQAAAEQLERPLDAAEREQAAAAQQPMAGSAPVSSNPKSRIQNPKYRLAILLSGRGSNFEAISDAVESGSIPNAEIVAVISDVPEAPGLARAMKRNLPVFSFARAGFRSRAALEAKILEVLEEKEPDLICLAGYMRLLSREFVGRYTGRILNIHPALLPKFRGLNAQKRALEARESVSGCTVHFVDEGTDTGPIVLQRRVLILPGDTEESLSARILEQEHVAYPEAIARVLEQLVPSG